LKLSLLILGGILFYYLAVVRPGWGNMDTEENIMRDWHKVPWTNSPALLTSEINRSDVLSKLLELDREEIKFWQDQLFTMSFWVNAAILGIVSFVLQRRSPTAVIRYTSAGVCLCLSIFYILFVRVAEGAMVGNDHDLRGIQYALGLFKPGLYLNGQSIYGNEPVTEQFGVMGHSFIHDFVLFNVMLVIVSIFLILVFLPWQQKKSGPEEKIRK